MTDVHSRNIRLTAMPYDKAGVKVMPIGNGSTEDIKVTRTGSGELCVSTPNYSISIGRSSASVETNDGSASININKQGINIIKQSDNSKYYQDLTDGEAKTTWRSKNGDVQWEDTMNSDGSRSFIQLDPRNRDGDPMFKMVIDKDGKITFSGLKPASLEIKGDVDLDVTDGDVNVNADNITLNGDTKRLVTYGELKQAMDLLWIAMTTTPIVGNGSPQPTWTGLDPVRGIDISASETQTIKTGG